MRSRAKWIDSLTYVYSPGGGVDIDGWYFENFGNPNWSQGATGALRLAPLDDASWASAAAPVRRPPQKYHEPRVPFEGVPQSDYGHSIHSTSCSWPSRRFTPVTANSLFDAIGATFIEF